MRNTFFLGVLLSIFLFSCKDDETPLVSDFEVSVTGQAPNAELVITNKSTSAIRYAWTFGKGASIENSSEETPVVKVDKAGDLTIKLIASNGAEDKEVSKTVTVPGVSAILTYTNIELGQEDKDPDYGRFFSTSEGKVFKNSEVKNDNGAKIDIAYYGSTGGFKFFESPDDLHNSDFQIPNATTTKVDNYESGFKVATFDSMTDETELKALTIEHDGDAIGTASFPLIVLFENAEGRKGAIKLKEQNSSKLVVDIKVQKY